ncbi:hypothetical protein [Actinocrispum wychmicini]|uniref:Uncharacterized protein n=1 Tax=Actinocrispum wychmicini TaxID=1213861 RepID=A0A4R2JVM0_9PSEU|nr:hypothetical protein [Actinocrispum wychmicini]TCO64473.1 hypothetical protein EV192_101249 [Actinocrispum wychmicini]
MTESTKTALVLHLASGGEPLVYALSEEGATALAARLQTLMTSGGVDAPLLADESKVTINFAHVATAHFEEAPSNRVYGSANKGPHGFAR